MSYYSFPNALRGLEKIHGRFNTYLKVKNSPYFDITTPTGDNACSALLKSIEEYLLCMLYRNKERITKDEESILMGYCEQLNKIQKDISMFNGEKYINILNLKNAHASWNIIWRIREKFSDKENDLCDFSKIKQIEKLIWR